MFSAEFSCDGVPKTAPTRSPAYLGASAAVTAAEILERWLTGSLKRTPELLHYFCCMPAHRSWTTRVARNVHCRCPHEQWTIAGCLPGEMPLKEVGVLSVPGLPFVRRLRCSCGAEQSVLFVAARLTDEQVHCHVCAQRMQYGALDLSDEIDFSALEDVGPGSHALALADIGIINRDIVRIGDSFFEIERQCVEQVHG
jgi:hypothetical protein